MFRKTHRLLTCIAAVMVAAALAAPASSFALPIGLGMQSPDAQDSARDAQRGIDRPTYTPSTPVAPAPTPAPEASSGFDWGDAGIAAGAVLGLVLVGTGVMFSVVHRRRRLA